MLTFIHLCYCHDVFSFFFFSSRRRHTRFDCDWSSDVCSSDLLLSSAPRWRQRRCSPCLERPAATDEGRPPSPGDRSPDPEIGRASCRESVDLGGRRIIKKKKSRYM